MAHRPIFPFPSSRENGGFHRRAVTVGSSLLAASGFATLGLAGTASGTAGAASPPFLSHFTSVTTVASTVPANGDVNPYGIVSVPMSTGKLVAGDTLSPTSTRAPTCRARARRSWRSRRRDADRRSPTSTAPNCPAAAPAASASPRP